MVINLSMEFKFFLNNLVFGLNVFYVIGKIIFKLCLKAKLCLKKV